MQNVQTTEGAPKRDVTPPTENHGRILSRVTALPNAGVPPDDVRERIFQSVQEQTGSAPSVSQEHGMWEGPRKPMTVLRADGTHRTVDVPQKRKWRFDLLAAVRKLYTRPAASALPDNAAIADPPSKEESAPPKRDLDALLAESAPAPEHSAQEEQPRQPELPSTPLMAEPKEDTSPQKLQEDMPVPKKETAQTVADPPAIDTTPPAKQPAKEVAAPAQEIVYKPKPKHRISALGEFFGAVKYFGLGKERFTFVQNLATMLNAGLPLIDALKTLQVETRVRPMKKLIGRIVTLVENGSALWRAMEDQHFFSPHAIALIRIGEEAGNLAKNMEYLSAQQEKDQALKAKVTMAMIYPVIVLTIMFIIIIGLGMFVLPNLISVLFSLNVELPFTTRMVIAFTNFFTTYGATAVPAMLVGFLLLGILLKFTPLKVVGQWMLFKIPGIGRLVREATIARFGVILGGLLQAGVPLVDALESLGSVTSVVSYKILYKKMLAHIVLGDSFSKCFKAIRHSERLLPVSVQQLVTTGEKSGSLADILLKVADIYEKKANNTAEKLPVILEPMLLLFIGGLVGTIAFSIIVPIYSIVGNVGR